MHFTPYCAACITPAKTNEHGPWFNVDRLHLINVIDKNEDDPPNDTFFCYDIVDRKQCIICYPCAEKAQDYTILPYNYDFEVGIMPPIMQELTSVEIALITLTFHVGLNINLRGENVVISPQLLPLHFHGHFSATELPLSLQELRQILTVSTDMALGFILTDELCIRRDRLHAALAWLTRHSKPYENVSINWKRLNNLPVGGPLPEFESYKMTPEIEREIPLGLQNSIVPLLNAGGSLNFAEACPTLFPNGVGPFAGKGEFMGFALQEWTLGKGPQVWNKVPSFAVMTVWILEDYWKGVNTWLTEDAKETMRRKLGLEEVWKEFGRDEVHTAASLRYSRRNGFYVAEDDNNLIDDL